MFDIHFEQVDANNFREKVLEESYPVLIKFYFDGCGPCKAMSPFLQQLAKKHEEHLKIVEFDTLASEENKELFENYGGRGVPLLLFFYRGTLKHRFITVDYGEIEAELNEQLTELGLL